MSADMSRNVAIAYALVVLTLLAALALTAVQRDAEASPGTTERVSVDSLENQANGFNCCADITPDGRYVAFSSDASNLVAGDTNNVRDAFVRDLATGTTERISVSSAGMQGNGSSGGRSISSDGRFIAFSSNATNLAADATPSITDVFLRDRLLGTTELLSVSSSEVQGNGTSNEATVSDDGRFVVFRSGATNLAPGDPGINPDVFLRDRLAGTTQVMSVSDAGVWGNNTGDAPVISGDGRYVAFSSGSSNLVPGDSNSTRDVFVRDRIAGTIEIASLDSNEAQGTSESVEPDISTDGRFVGFHSMSALVPGDSNGTGDIFLRDRLNGTTERVSVDSLGGQSNGFSSFAGLSADAAFAAFESSANNLVPGDTNGQTDVFLRDRQAGTTVRVNVSTTGSEANGSTSLADAAVSSDGHLVSFASSASNLVSGDTNGVRDVFVHDVEGAAPTPTPTPNVTPTPGPLYAVNSTSDVPDTNPGDGICLTAAGECTLRAAIQESNAHAGVDTINFNISSQQLAPTIPLASPLPVITDRVTIDGSTQPQYSGIPRIEVDGQNAGPGADGLVLSAANSTVRALAVTRFGGDGIELTSGGNTIQNNYIGVRPDGFALGNGSHGILIAASGNSVVGNNIRSNGSDGIFVGLGASNNISANDIRSNTGLGIDLAPDGVTPNDNQDPDMGPNDLQNFPVITRAFKSDIIPSPLEIDGNLNSTPNTTFTLELFRNDTSCGEPQLVEGETLLGSLTVTTGSGGFASFQTGFTIFGPHAGSSVTATARDPAGSTSEFSACFPISYFGQPTPTPTATASPTATATRTATPTATASPTSSPTPPPPPDTDSDGWSNGSETIIGTDPLLDCGVDAWPADVNNNGSSDTADIALLTNDFGDSVPAEAPPRHDIGPDPPNGFVDTADIARLTGLFGQQCGT